MPRKPRIAIIGAGPIGLEAALYARLKGYDVTVYERGRIAENVRQWGHVRMFSPFGMNSSEWGRETLRTEGYALPASNDLLTGAECVVQYLQPMSCLPYLAGVVREKTRIHRVMRSRSRKTELVGNPRRADEPFHLLAIQDENVEELESADIVLDCAGTYGNANWLGAGGGPCPGELDNECNICYAVPPKRDIDPNLTELKAAKHREELQLHHYADLLKGRMPAVAKYVGERTMVIGAGHTAATTVTGLSRLAVVDDRTQILWVTRLGGVQPVRRFEQDPLIERDRIAKLANDLACTSPNVEWLAPYVVRRIEWNAEGGKVRVTLQSVDGGVERQELVDNIIANVGYRPDRSLYEELQVHECYATEGPMRLAAKLLGETSADCLDQTSHGPEVLRNPEPNFYILGMKSYGRNSNFLIQIGLQQIVDVFTLIEQDWS